jgi:hypothetical protein
MLLARLLLPTGGALAVVFSVCSVSVCVVAAVQLCGGELWIETRLGEEKESLTLNESKVLLVW